MIELICPTCGKVLRIPDEYAGILGKCNGCGDPVQVPGIPRLDGPTPTRPPALSSSDAASTEVAPVDTFTRNDSIGIDMAVSQREMARAHKDMAESLRKQTLMSRITCGCLLLTLTAPIWIVGIVFFATMGFTAAVAAIATFFGMTKPIFVDPGPVPVVVVEEPGSEPEPEPEPAAEVPEPLPLSKSVYSDANRYHVDRRCGGLAEPYGMSLLQVALEKGKQPCPICAPNEAPNLITIPATPAPLEAPKKEASISTNQSDPPALESTEPIVAYDQVGEKYHKSNCPELKGVVKDIHLSKALARGLTACARCKPEK